MFERRLKILLALLGLCGLAVAVRLGQMQIVHAQRYRQAAAAALIRPAHYVAPIRGRIVSRDGTVLAEDQPTWELRVHFGALSADPRYVRRLAGLFRRTGRLDRNATRRASEAAVRAEMHECWEWIAQTSGATLKDLLERRQAICGRVEEVRRAVARRRDRPDIRVALQEEFHTVLGDLGESRALRIQQAMPDWPWVTVQPASRRQVRDAAPVCHLLGRMGQVSPDDLLKTDADEDPLGCYLPGETRGVSGIERLAEPLLRGRRGLIERDVDGRVTRRTEPIDGRDVRLTIDLDLQRAVLARLERAVRENATASGAAAVVLDVATRQVLALVSCPVYDPRRWNEDYASLIADTRRCPTLFRAVAGEYPPGSIVKPISLTAGLATGRVTPHTQFECQGRGWMHQEGAFRCWTYWRPGMVGHGPVDAVQAIKHSCNVYFYHLGERVCRGTGGRLLGADPLCEWFGQFGLGRAPETGLIEESAGALPWSGWLFRRFGRPPVTGDARFLAIGQGAMTLTPLQAANAAAVLATGEWISPTVLLGDGRSRPVWRLPVSDAQWEVVRRGMWAVVNERQGTAHRTARSTRIEICGKTGSAQAVCRVLGWEYRFRLRSGAELSVQAPTVSEARRRLRLPADAGRLVARQAAGWWPWSPRENPTKPTHAWFIGFAPPRRPQVAVAVLIEYGGSGGKIAGPVARDVFEMLLDSPRAHRTSKGRP